LERKTIEINHLLLDIFQNMTKYEEYSLQRGELKELSITEIHTIECIGQHKAVSMSQVAAKLGITQSTLTVAVDKLVKKNYVMRQRDENDRRVVMIKLENKGRLAYKMHERFHKLLVRRMTTELTQNEEGIVISSLGKINSFFNMLWKEI
jgi:DNA-binding MarR family transcriptional regulator